MELFKNKDVRKTLRIFIVCSFIAIIIGVVINILCGIYTIAVCLVFGVVYFRTTSERYRKIAELSFELNRVLHGDYTMDFTMNQEGELSILGSEIHKMTVRLQEQANMLLQDKKYLSNSIADISHQLRTPLTSINLIVSRLYKNDMPENEKNEAINELNALLSRIDWLISSLLKLSKIESGTITFKKESVNISDLINETTKPFVIPMELREQKLKMVVGEKINFEGDFYWSVEAVGNVIKNCVEHTPVGGTITVEGNDTAIYTEIIISDNGMGIEPSDLPHLFERFYKGANSSDANIGIGLALSKMIIEGQNGTIIAENNGGARFIIRFYKKVV